MKRNSVSVRINLLILLLVIVIAGGLVTAVHPGVATITASAFSSESLPVA